MDRGTLSRLPEGHTMTALLLLSSSSGVFAAAAWLAAEVSGRRRDTNRPSSMSASTNHCDPGR